MQLISAALTTEVTTATAKKASFTLIGSHTSKLSLGRSIDLIARSRNVPKVTKVLCPVVTFRGLRAFSLPGSDAIDQYAINKRDVSRACVSLLNPMRFLDSILASTAVVALVAMVNAQTPTSTIFNPAPSRIVGQAVLQQQGILTATGPNLVEGREFNGPQAIAIDTSVSPPILYVADSGNNRVLAWKNAAAFTKGTFADKVIGQRDFLTISAKGPGSDLTTGVSAPDALAVDNAGNLYVVDAGNNRILRYPAPFSQTGALLAVNLIIGQKDLNGAAPNAGQTAPSATTLALTSGGA